jgi:hypothetical protein
MKMIVERGQKHRGFPFNKFEYSMHVKIDFTNRETELLERYKGWNEPIGILSDNKDVKGFLSVDPKTLSTVGADWSDDTVYEALSAIPQVIAQVLKGRFGNYDVREQWGGQNANEVIEVDL